MNASNEKTQDHPKKFVYWMLCPLFVMLIGGLSVFDKNSSQPADLAATTKPEQRSASNVTLSQTKPKSRKHKTLLTKTDQLRRLRLLAEIRGRLNSMSTSEFGSGESSEIEEEEGNLNREYVRNQTMELVPLIRECYQFALEDVPDVDGRIDIEVSLIGDPELGGLIENSKVVGGDFSEDSDFAECLRETMYALDLPAPEDGGSRVFKIPFRFRPE